MLGCIGEHEFETGKVDQMLVLTDASTGLGSETGGSFGRVSEGGQWQGCEVEVRERFGRRTRRTGSTFRLGRVTRRQHLGRDNFFGVAIGALIIDASKSAAVLMLLPTCSTGVGSKDEENRAVAVSPEENCAVALRPAVLLELSGRLAVPFDGFVR